jgi:ABC-2 type transport system ATP-binding protein
MNAIELQHLSYRYRRNVDALHDVSMTVTRGAIHGLIGPNGAGKSTMLQCCAGLRYASSGSVHIFGNDARRVDPISSHLLGYLSEAIKLPPKYDARAAGGVHRAAASALGCVARELAA